MKTIIIGAGLGGLITGLLLKKARPDDEVIIYELNKIPGGFCTAFPKATTYNNEKIVYNINIPLMTSDFQDNEPFGLLFKYLGVKNIKWRVVDKLFQFYPLEKEPFLFTKNGDKELLKRAKDEKERKSLEIFFKKIKKFYNDIFHHAYLPPTFFQAIKMLFTIPDTVFKLLFDKPYLDTIKHIGVSSQDIILIFFAPEAFMGVDVDKVTAMGEMVMIQSFLENSSLQPAEGFTFQSLSNNLADRFVEMGGKLILNTRVDEIVFDNKKAKGVRIKDKIEESDNVILSVAQDAIKNLIKSGQHIPAVRSLIKKIEKLPYPNSDYYCYYLVDKKTVEENPKLIDIAYHVYRLKPGRDESNWKLALWVPRELYNDKYYVMALVMTEQSQEKIDWWCKLRETDYKKYTEEKEKVAQKYLEIVQEVEPIFKKNPPLKHLLTMTPASYLPYGSKYPICGLAQVPENFGIKRMAPKILKNLFISSGACFSGGLWGAIAGGWQGFVSFYKNVYGIEIGNRDVMYKPGLKNLP